MCTVTMRASSPTEKERPVSQPGELTRSTIQTFHFAFLLDFFLRQTFLCILSNHVFLCYLFVVEWFDDGKGS